MYWFESTDLPGIKKNSEIKMSRLFILLSIQTEIVPQRNYMLNFYKIKKNPNNSPK